MRTLQHRALPGRRRHLVGDAVVDRLVELVGAVGHAQHVQPQLPERRVGVAPPVGASRLSSASRNRSRPSQRISSGSAGSSGGTGPTCGPRRRCLQRAGQSNTQAAASAASATTAPRARRRRVEHRRADPADLAVDALLTCPGASSPLAASASATKRASRTTAAPTSRTAARSQRQVLELVLLAGRAVQVEAHSQVSAWCERRRQNACGQPRSDCLALFEVGVGEAITASSRFRVVRPR